MDHPNPFRLLPEVKTQSSLGGKAKAVGARVAERMLGLEPLAQGYEGVRGLPSKEFLRGTLERLGVTYEVVHGGIHRVPKEGPIVVVSNHPFGGVEGMILSELLQDVRDDVGILANYILGRIPEMRDRFILVDPFETNNAAKKNVSPLREALARLRQGGGIALFPSGTVSHLHLRKREITDPLWSPSVARLIRKSHATVLPIYFHGRNSALFQAAGLIHPLLRTALLPREMYGMRGVKIPVHIGKPIPFEKLTSFSSDEDLMDFLRLRTYILKNRSNHGDGNKRSEKRSKRCSLNKPDPIVEADDLELLADELENLPPETHLYSDGDLHVHIAEASQIPYTLREIGRLRETTFRKVHEGTGRSRDLDRFDNYYLHLFIWNSAKKEVVGSYRVGKTDQLVPRFGVHSLYTHTLFDYSEEVLDQIGPALEVGRTFVREEYQRNYSSLLLLWKGIGRYVVRNPQYKMLFGVVSINNEYENVSQQLITAFLKANSFKEELAKLIKARKPLREERMLGFGTDQLTRVVKDIREISELIAEVEAREKAVPVLLRQYLQLGGKLLGFNVDPEFGTVLDGLILVNLAETQPKLLERYLGKEGAPRFLEYHQKSSLPRTGTLS